MTKNLLPQSELQRRAKALNKCDPGDGPTLGLHLRMFRNELRLTVDEARFIFGLTMVAYKKMTVGAGLHLPVDPSVAAQLRYYILRPDAIPLVFPKPTPAEVWEAIRALQPNITLEYYGVTMGREKVSGWRWVKDEGNFGTIVERCARLLMKTIEEGEPETWEKIILREGAARGIPDVYQAGQWQATRPRMRKPKAIKVS